MIFARLIPDGRKVSVEMLLKSIGCSQLVKQIGQGWLHATHFPAVVLKLEDAAKDRQDRPCNEQCHAQMLNIWDRFCIFAT
jgi:hypothetical protein